MSNNVIRAAYDAMNPTFEEQRRMLGGVYAKAAGAQRPARPAMRKALFVPLAAAIVLLLSTTALAAAVWTGVIDWSGALKREEALPVPTTAPVQDNTPRTLEERAMELLSQCAEGELWIVRFADASGNTQAAATQRVETLPSLAVLKQRLAAFSAPLALPIAMPDGYMLREARISYECGASASYILLGSEAADGVTLDRYASSDPSGDLINGYMLFYEDASGGQLRIRADLAFSGDEHGFGVTDEDGYTAESVAGMDAAIALTRPMDSILYLRQKLPAPVAYRSVFDLMNPKAAEATLPTFDEAHYELYATALSANDLIALWTNQRAE